MLKKIFKIICFIFMLAIGIVGAFLCVGGINEVIVSGKKDSITDEGVFEFTIDGNHYKCDDEKYEFWTYDKSGDSKVTKRVYTYKDQHFMADEDKDLDEFTDELNNGGKKKTVAGTIMLIIGMVSSIVILKKKKSV